VHGVTGGQMREFARRLRGAAPRPLTEEMILALADDQEQQTGIWPMAHSGSVLAAPEEKWWNLDAALKIGARGLHGGSTLARLLADRRGVRNQSNLPALSQEKVLEWADEFFQRTNGWPNHKSGMIDNSGGDTWLAIDMALRQGHRGLPGGSSVARLLDEKRGVRNVQNAPALTEELILEWADSHKKITGDWPRENSGAVSQVVGETWSNISVCLQKGMRELPGGSSLAKLLAEKRGVRNRGALPKLTEEQILSWVDSYHQRTGKWPKAPSGAIAGAPGENWKQVNRSLEVGLRGLPGGSSLVRLLASQRGVRNPKDLPPLSGDQILSWADAHHERSGEWPTSGSGQVSEEPAETWRDIDTALARGRRGLPGGSNLAKLLGDKRGVPTRFDRPLAEYQVLAWADLHWQRTGSWPMRKSGPVTDARGETWARIENALNKGIRGLPGGSSLARLIKEHRSEVKA
jgi:hypothetical protein